MLELAAKAAGYAILGYGELVGGSPCLYLKEADFTGMWNPLEDDGDALRLAVKLRIHLTVGNGWSAASGPAGGFLEQADDHLAATRLAIVRAAAAIGEKGNG